MESSLANKSDQTFTKDYNLHVSKRDRNYYAKKYADLNSTKLFGDRTNGS